MKDLEMGTLDFTLISLSFIFLAKITNILSIILSAFASFDCNSAWDIIKYSCVITVAITVLQVLFIDARGIDIDQYSGITWAINAFIGFIAAALQIFVILRLRIWWRERGKSNKA